MVSSQLHADLFSHAINSPLEFHVFVAVDERGEGMPDEMCLRCNGKQRRRRGGQSVQLPGYEQSKGNIIALTWVIKMRSSSYGGSLNVVQKVSHWFLLASFVFVGL